MDESGWYDVESESQDHFAHSTAWSSRVAPKNKSRRVYGRRGSDAVGNSRRIKTSSLLETKERNQNTDDVVDQFDDTEIEECDNWNTTSPHNGTNFLADSEVPLPPPHRGLKKWKSISGESPATSRPVQPGKLMRSQSVSALTPQRKLSSSFPCISKASSVRSFVDEAGRDFENFNPNYFPSSDNFHGLSILEESTPPKRSAVTEENSRKGRKKCKPAKHSFLQNNDFSALNVVNSDGNNTRGNKNSRKDSFSDLARSHCEVEPAWSSNSTNSYSSNSYEEMNRRRSYSSDIFSQSSHPSQDEAMDGTDSVLSANMSTTSSTRKRGVSKSHFLFDESPVSRSRSRMLSPLPVRTSDSFKFVDSIDSKQRTASKLMNISFSSNEKKFSRQELDMTMSDDDLYVSGNSDISVESDDDMMTTGRTNKFNSIKQPSSTRSSRIIALDKVTVDDVINCMPSFEDIQFLSSSLKENHQGQGGSLSWTVAPPVVWAAKRRDAFFQATRKLGFTFRSGGGNVAYIQIPKARGKVLLNLLNSSLATYDKRKERLLEASASSGPKEFIFSSAVKREAQPVKNLKFTPNELTSNSWCPNSLDRKTDDLSHIMSNLNINAIPSAKNKAENEVPLSNDHNYFDCLDSERRTSRFKSRDSSEYHSNSADLNAQMLGATPVPPRLRGRPPRLSLQSTSSRTTASVTMESVSPFLTNTAVPKPTHINTHVDCNVNSNEFVLTPLIGRQNDAWGSRPFNNRDWGTSEPCEADTIESLFQTFNQTRKSAGYSEKSDEMLSSDIGSSCLGLDFESVSQYCDDFESLAGSSSPTDNDIQEYDSTYTDRFFAEGFDGNAAMTKTPFSSRADRRRQTAFAKHRRMSLFASAVNPVQSFLKQRKSLFVRQPCTTPASKQNILFGSAPEFFSENTPLVVDKKNEESPLEDVEVLRTILGYLEEKELLFVAGLVCRKWSDAATHSHANLMLSSVANCYTEGVDNNNDLTRSQRSWGYLTTTFPWACFLSEGAFKRVYKVFNSTCKEEEAVSVMNVNQIHSTGNINVVGAELAVSVMLSSLVRRGICPNFVATRGMFSCQYEPPDNHWGTVDNRIPNGKVYCPTKIKKKPRQPKNSGHYQYIRMELCGEGDAEEFLKRQPDECLLPIQARNFLFQISFALYAAAEKFSLKHYDVKLLNVFLQRMPENNGGDVILRYGLGQHVFALQSLREDALIAKLADYGTANVDCVTNGQNVTIAQFTTLENTPPDFLILGDQAVQGHGHDCFGLGLCMLHLFTGHAPYEEILEDVTCPCNLKKELRRIWENEEEIQYSVVRSIVLADVYKDEDGMIIEGEADETLYDTLYRYLVLFGIPDDTSVFSNSKVMAAIKTTLRSEGRQKKGRGRNRKNLCDAKKFSSDRSKFSLEHGNNPYISRARVSLSAMDGGMDLLLSLVRFDAQQRASALNVLNSTFMAPLREIPSDAQKYPSHAEVFSYTAFSTQT